RRDRRSRATWPRASRTGSARGAKNPAGAGPDGGLVADWQALTEEIGAADPADTLRLIRYLADQGASEQEISEAARAGWLGPLGLELALRPPGETVPFEEAARQAGLEVDEARRLWRALGFPDPAHAQPRVTSARGQTLRVLAEMSRSLFGQETGLRLARVLGSAAAQLAEAIVD